MRKKNFKGRCEKRMIRKCTEVCRTYDAIQYAYADLLQMDEEVKEIRCNVQLDVQDDRIFVIDCLKQTMPVWRKFESVDSVLSESELLSVYSQYSGKE